MLGMSMARPNRSRRGNVKTFDSFVANVRQALAKLGAERFDYLINNAGTSLHKNFDQTTEEELDAIYNVHFKGVYFLTQKLLPLINDGGRIVNISSGLARFSLQGSSAYGSMKGAVEVLLRYLANLDRVGSRSIRSPREQLPPTSAAAWFGIIRRLINASRK